ncbi:hypothetical protein NC653_030677 [Populus alba x Populus x berolinensis]|uniref:Uncharacterized protein n=1 Tax=Populus alba x Populus x berolinensis TaxID=444605 RepID=A0AAD6LZG9_9ROSI|nr:hypothetical protein NC653_030677 [Populus alba x Populus x berolinensis]
MNNLTHLMSFQLFSHNFTSHLQRDLCLDGLLVNFTVRLFRVRLEWNQFTGNISEDFGLYPNLIYVDLSHNDLSELGEATGLQLIDLSSNLLKGTIPKELVQLKALYNLTLHNNHRFGVLPVEIQMLSKLRALNLASNNLGGSIPKQLGECSNMTILLPLNLAHKAST